MNDFKIGEKIKCVSNSHQIFCRINFFEFEKIGHYALVVGEIYTVVRFIGDRVAVRGSKGIKNGGNCGYPTSCFTRCV